MEILETKFEKIKNSLINYLIEQELKSNFYICVDNYKEAQNYVELSEILKGDLFANCYQKDIVDIAIYLKERNFINAYVLKQIQICVHVFYTENYNINNLEITEIEIVFSVREFKKYCEEF